MADLWRVLRTQSVLLTAERRMGKTSLLKKMRAEPDPEFVPVLRNLQDISSPKEFVRRLLADVETYVPAANLGRGSIRKALERAGVRSIGVSSISVEFEPASDESWKDVVMETMAAVHGEADRRVVFLWDELPHMIAGIGEAQGPLLAREMLDVFRSVRESFDRVRMVYSGSLGLHHVLADLRDAGTAWAPVNDMRPVGVPPLEPDASNYLGRELLVNESVACLDVETVAATITEEINAVPFYVHLAVDGLLELQRTHGGRQADAIEIPELVQGWLEDDLDRWQLKHYVDRLRNYYGDEADTVKALLDVLAVEGRPVDFDRLRELMAARIEPPPPERLHELLDLLAKDHYLGSARGTIDFRLDLLRRAWIARRRL